MRLEDILNHRAVTGFGVWLGQVMPPWFGHGLARLAAALICRFKPGMYHVVRGNLRQILGPDVDKEVLDAKTHALFLHAARANYDFFHAVEQSAEEIARQMEVPQWVIDQIHSAMAEKRGVLILGTHMSNFNLGILALGALNVPIQALSLADPNEGFTFLNRLRTKWGMELTPISAQTLRQAIRRLESGGVVVSAFDFPTPHNSHLFPFFGKPAYFPVGPARLARIPDIVVLVGSCRYDPERGYLLHVEALDVERTGDRRHDTLVNTQRIAGVLEGLVAANPDQWLMLYPFWPDTEGAAAQHPANGNSSTDSGLAPTGEDLE